jgi:hypothetical protein
MFPRLNIPDTSYPPYDESVSIPNFVTFQQYEESGFMELYPIITKAILTANNIDIDSNQNLQVAYLPI